MTTLPIQIDETTARAFEAAEPTRREQIALYVRSYIAQALLSKEERVSLFVQAADALGAEAEANGWNDELNEALLRGDFDDE